MDTPKPINPIEPITNMDAETLKRLAILETKLDYLIDHSKNSTTELDSLEKRVSGLEGQKQWLVGACAVMVITATVFIYALRQYTLEQIRLDHETYSYLDKVCTEARTRNIPMKELSNLCL